jgi:hypothetical protein
MWVVVGGGVVAVVVLAVVIGRAVDHAARTEAWKRVAASRRINHELRHELEQFELALSVREDVLDTREQRLDVREGVLLQREADLVEAEENIRSTDDPDGDRPPDTTS